MMLRSAAVRRYVPALVIAMLVAAVLSYAPIRAASSTIVINEFRTRGAGGANDEFVELRNVSGGELSIAGWILAGVDGSGNPTELVTLPIGAAIKPGCYYLIVSSGGEYQGVELGDVAYSVPERVPDNGGFALLNPSFDVVDQVGMSYESLSFEGTPLAPLTNNMSQSYTRSTTIDTDNNPADFSYTTSPSPTNYDPAGCSTGRVIRRP